MGIRNFQPSDRDRCRSIWAEMVQRHRDIYEDPTIGGENPGLEFDHHLSKVGAERIWVATSEEDVVGLVSLIVEGEQAEVEPIAVASEYRDSGIGRQLLKRAVIEAEKLGVICLYAKPVARNIEAISFFYDAGFRILGHVQLFMWLGSTTPDQWKPGPELFGKPFMY